MFTHWTLGAMSVSREQNITMSFFRTEQAIIVCTRKGQGCHDQIIDVHNVLWCSVRGNGSDSSRR